VAWSYSGCRPAPPAVAENLLGSGHFFAEGIPRYISSALKNGELADARLLAGAGAGAGAAGVGVAWAPRSLVIGVHRPSEAPTVRPSARCTSAGLAPGSRQAHAVEANRPTPIIQVVVQGHAVDTLGCAKPMTAESKLAAGGSQLLMTSTGPQSGAQSWRMAITCQVEMLGSNLPYLVHDLSSRTETT
jgi:hypothetical protein